MGISFSGPDAFKFFNFTPKATAVLQRDPFLLVILLLVLVGMGGLIGLAFYISFVTGKPYRKPKEKGKDGKKETLGGRLGRALRI